MQSYSSPPLREDYAQGDFPSASDINLSHRFLNGMHGEGGIEVFHDSVMGIIVSGGGGMNLSLFAFGIRSMSQDGNNKLNITLNGGIVHFGAAVEALAGGPVAVSTSPAFVMVRMNKRSFSASFFVAGNVPADTPEFAHQPLYEFKLVDQQYRLEMIHHIGSIHL